MSVDDDRTLYVANLHKNVTEDILYELFLQAGPIERVSIPATGSKNFRYGFVTYVHQCAVDYAIQLYKGTCLFKKELFIRRRGDKGSHDQQMNTSDRYTESMNNQVSQDQPMSHGQPYLPDYIHISNDNGNSHKGNSHLPGLMQLSLKGQFSDRCKPYDRDSRRHYSSRSDNSRNRHRSHFDSNYNKPYKGRQGRY